MEYEKIEKICNIIRNASITEASLALGGSAIGCITGNLEFAVEAFLVAMPGIEGAIVSQCVKEAQKTYWQENMSKTNIPQECFCNGAQGDDDFTKQEIYAISPSKLGLDYEEYNSIEQKPRVRTIGALK